VLRRLHCHFVSSSTGHWRLAHFPDRWKLSFVTPIFKSGKRNEVSNYRGIAILLTVGKIFELLVYKHMYDDLKDQLEDCQNGFV
jgi:hypothetical protein